MILDRDPSALISITFSPSYGPHRSVSFNCCFYGDVAFQSADVSLMHPRASSLSLSSRRNSFPVTAPE